MDRSSITERERHFILIRAENRWMGALAKADPAGFFHINSKDRGFDPLVEHLKKEKISVVRSVSVEAMPCFAPKKSRPGPHAKTH